MQRTKTILKDLTPIVQKVLEDKPASRDDDMLLYCYFLNTQGISKNISIWALRHKIRTKQLPSLESIGRIRRKLQQLHSDIAPTPQVKQGKAKQEIEYKKYARDLTDGYGDFLSPKGE